MFIYMCVFYILIYIDLYLFIQYPLPLQNTGWWNQTHYYEASHWKQTKNYNILYYHLLVSATLLNKKTIKTQIPLWKSQWNYNFIEAIYNCFYNCLLIVFSFLLLFLYLIKYLNTCISICIFLFLLPSAKVLFNICELFEFFLLNITSHLKGFEY